MRQHIRRIILIVGATLLALTTIATPAMAAGPRIMIVYGRPLVRPVIFSNWGENEELMVSSNDSMSVTNVRLRGRPSLRMALFWGMEWVRYMKQHKPPSALRPSQANQFARFYPAYGAAPALLVFDAIPGPYTSLIRRIGPAGIAVLARHGIPVRLPVRSKVSSYFVPSSSDSRSVASLRCRHLARRHEPPAWQPGAVPPPPRSSSMRTFSRGTGSCSRNMGIQEEPLHRH